MQRVVGDMKWMSNGGTCTYTACLMRGFLPFPLWQEPSRVTGWAGCRAVAVREELRSYVVLHVVLAFWVCLLLSAGEAAASGRPCGECGRIVRIVRIATRIEPMDVEMTAAAAKARARGGGQKTTKLRPRGPEVRVRVPRFGV